jgi:hypothetical protein
MNEPAIELSSESVSTNPTLVDYSPMVSLVASGFAQMQNTIEKGLEKNEKALQEVQRAQREMQKLFRSVPQGLLGQRAGASSPITGESSRQPHPVAVAPTSTISRAARNKTNPNWNKFLVSCFAACLPLANAYQSALQDHLKRLLKIKALDESLLRFVLTDQELHDYNIRALGCVKITAENFQLDMSKSLSIPFNLEAIEVFTLDFLEKVKTHRWYKAYSIPVKYLTINEVSDAIHQHLRHVFSVHKQHSQPNMAENRQEHKKHLGKANRSTRKGQVRYLPYSHHMISFYH